MIKEITIENLGIDELVHYCHGLLVLVDMKNPAISQCDFKFDNSDTSNTASRIKMHCVAFLYAENALHSGKRMRKLDVATSRKNHKNQGCQVQKNLKVTFVHKQFQKGQILKNEKRPNFLQKFVKITSF